MEPILTCTALTKNYANLTALNNATLSVNKGRIVGLLGPNGSGKTTLIKLTAGLLTPDSGSISVAGIPVGADTKKLVSYLPERTYLNDWMKVKDIIAFFADFYEDFNQQKAFEMLRSLNISPDDRLKSMSKGTKEKVQLILVMSRDAALFVLDEPIAGVDPAARDYILNTIITNYNPEATIIITTHLVYDIERILDDVIFINNGNLVMAATTDEIRAKYGKSLDSFFREEFRC